MAFDGLSGPWWLLVAIVFISGFADFVVFGLFCGFWWPFVASVSFCGFRWFLVVFFCGFWWFWWLLVAIGSFCLAFVVVMRMV